MFGPNIGNSEKAREYLQNKYSLAFKETKGPTFNMKNSSYVYYFCEEGNEGVSFTVTERGGSFSDTYQQEKKSYKYKMSLIDALRSKNIEAICSTVVEESKYPSTYEIYTYMVIMDINNKETVKDVLKTMHFDLEHYVTIYFVDESDYYDIYDKSKKEIGFNKNFIKKFNSCKEYTMDITDRKYVLWEENNYDKTKEEGEIS